MSGQEITIALLDSFSHFYVSGQHLFCGLNLSMEYFRWLREQEDKLPESDEEDTIASLKAKEDKITVSCCALKTRCDFNGR